MARVRYPVFVEMCRCIDAVCGGVAAATVVVSIVAVVVVVAAAWQRAVVGAQYHGR